MESPVPDRPIPSPPSKWRRFGRVLKKGLFRIFVVVLLWWGIAAIIPGMPGPGIAGRLLVLGVKSATDFVYFAFHTGDLEQAAEMVRRNAEEVSLLDSGTTDLPSAERMQRMPFVSTRDDSAAIAAMKHWTTAPPIRGRVINVLVMGIDSRLGARDARADAIHLFTINPDSGVVDIMSIPRDTYCDLGYPDSSTFNIIANARHLGYEGFMKKVEQLTRRGPVRYYAEVGFSQAMGMIELLGYKEPKKTLQFLRARKALAAGDIQRTYNQAVFMRDNLMTKFPWLTGGSGDLLLRAGLNFLTTNMTREFCAGLIYSLQQKDFPFHRDDAVRVRLLPQYQYRLKVMSADSATIDATLRQQEYVLGGPEEAPADLAKRLWTIIGQARADSARPGRVVSRLERLAEQHIWMQVDPRHGRKAIRDEILRMLDQAYRRLEKWDRVKVVQDIRESEKVLFEHAHPR